jgi:predicted alpha/beta-fold hydrolase
MSTKGEDRFDSTEASPWMRPFVPRRFLRNGHLQTIVGYFLPRTYSLPEPESQLIEVETATSVCGASFVLCHCHWQPAQVRSERLTMVLVHGLEGSSSSPSFALVGYSMGGNLVLKLAGELGGSPPLYLKAVVGVSPLMDLVASSAALARTAEPPLREQVSRRPAKALSPQGRALS